MQCVGSERDLAQRVTPGVVDPFEITLEYQNARLCAEAKDGQILVSSRIAEAVEAVAKLEDLGNVELKGLRRPVAAFNVVHSTGAADARPNLTVVARGPGPT